MTRTQIPPIVFFLLLPFVMLCWYVPLPGWHSISNDYIHFSIGDQMRLFYSVINGTVPLYIPGYIGGQSASALTLGQFYHPLSWIAIITPGYWSGQALLITTLLRMLALGCAHYALYRYFIRLGTPGHWAFLCSFIAIYNLRMLDCFRYGAALEAYTGFIFTCVALGYVWLEPGRRRYGYLIASLYWLLCSGHPQMVYYGLLGSGLFALLCPFLNAAPSGRDLLRYYVKCGACVAVALILSAAYLLPFYHDFVLANVQRTKQNYMWSIQWSDTVIGTITNFFMPLRSNVHGAFGGSTLILLALAAPLLCRRRMPLVLAVLVALTLIVMMGAATPLHYWVWSTLPMASSMRTPGRFGLFLPMLLALLLFHFPRNRAGVNSGVFLSAIVAALVYALYPLFVDYGVTYSSPMAIRPDIAYGVENSIFMLGIVILIAFALCCLRPGARMRRLVLCGCVMLQTMLTLTYGTWLIDAQPTPTKSALDQTLAKQLFFPTEEGFGMGRREWVEYNNQLDAAKLPAPLHDHYTVPSIATIATRYRIIPENKFFNILADEKTVLPTLIEAANGTSPASSFTEASSSLRLTYNSYNRLDFAVTSRKPGYVVVGYPAMEQWKIRVNDVPVNAARADGLYLAVPIESGNSLVEIIYESNAAIAGMLISVPGWIGVCCVFAPRRLRACIILLILLLAWFWYYSLTHGNNLGTHYEWSSDRP